MSSIWLFLYPILGLLVLLALTIFVEKHLPLAKKTLHILYMVLFPILAALTVIRLIQTKQFLGNENYYSLLLICGMLFTAIELLINVLQKRKIKSAAGNAPSGKSNFRYVIFILWANLYMLFSFVAAVIFLINEIVHK